MEEVIKVSNLTRKYKDFSLGPVDLSFPKGFATALIGANGAGKTTLMDIICGITAKTDGTVTYFGETDNADSGNIKERIGYCASQAMFPANWKVRDTLRLINSARTDFIHFSVSLALPMRKTVKSLYQVCRTV